MFKQALLPVQILFFLKSFSFQFFHVSLLSVCIPHGVCDHLEGIIGFTLLLCKLFLLDGLLNYKCKQDWLEAVHNIRN